MKKLISLVSQEDITIKKCIYTQAFYIYTKETLTEPKGEIDSNIIKVKDFNISLSIIDRIYT